MRILIAPQSFKGSLDAAQVGAAIATGLREGWPFAEAPQIALIPLADGGEGTLQALVAAGVGWELVPRTARGPLPDQQVPAAFGWRGGDDPEAFIEMAAVAGLPLVPPDQRDPSLTTTYGVGELMRAALDRGARRVFVALGGSATNDGGAGMAQALGARLLDAAGNDLPPGGGALARLEHIDASQRDPRLAAVEVIGVTDVTNPLCGPEGASAIYGPQKGATPDQVQALDLALARFAGIIRRDLGQDIAQVTGAGAAGGLGAGLLAFGGPQARLLRGADFVLQAVGFAERLRAADLVITGEGRLDAQVAYGKLTGTLARLAQAAGVPVICVCGGVGAGYDAGYALGITAVIVAADGPRSLESAMAHAPELIAGAVARGMQLWRVNLPHS